MKKSKKIIFLLLATLLLAGTLDVYAQDTCSTTKSSDYKASCDDKVKTHYGITYEIGKNPGQFYLTANNGTFRIAAIEEGYYDGNNKLIVQPLTHFKGNPADYINNNNKLIIGTKTTGKDKAQRVEVNAASFVNVANVPSGYEYALRFTIVPAVSDCKCQTPEDFQAAKAAKEKAGTFTEYIYIILRNFDQTSKPKVPNTNYNTAACQTIRSADINSKEYNNGPVNYNSVIEGAVFNHIAKTDDTNYWNKINKYKSLVPFCFSPRDVAQNFGDDQVKTIVQTAIQSTYAIYLPQTVVKDQNWQESIDRACRAVGGTLDSAGNCSKTGENWQILGENQEPSVSNELYCKYEWKNLGKDDESTGYKYTNINSYYAKTSKVSEKSYSYQYSSAQDKTTNGEPSNKCTRTCEEVVDVEYGPPQATIAGFCIEYQVKVTSHVKCTTSLDIHAPTQGELCVPIPLCVHSWGNRDQAGPSEEFDACIEKCDGGKYSDTCSTKCYNEVYKSTAKSKKLSLENKNTQVEFLTTDYSGVPDDIPHGGYYQRVNTNEGFAIEWVSTGNKDKHGTSKYGAGTYADYYFIYEKQRTINDHGTGSKKYFADKGGFKRQHVGDDGACNGKCTHLYCSDNTYLREEDLNSDYDRNIKIYNDIVNECAAQAICTEKTAEFSIAANVNGEWFEYPSPGTNSTKEFENYSGSKTSDKLVSRTAEGERTENRTKQGSSLLSYAGCYNDGSLKDWYQAEWSFPGTWANNKTGEISYIDKGHDATWHQTKNKFCLPLTIKNVNQKWWYYYMNEKSKHDIASNKGSYISSEYKKAHPEVVNQNSVPSKSEIDWNIRAATMKFGYFHWQFKINCFYAVYSEDNCSCKGQKGCNCTTNNPDNFSTRTIAKSDMFPSSDPDDSTGVIDKSQTGRVQGFNWTSAATIGEEKSKNYAVNPEMLISRIQKLGEKVYDEDKENEYLEYEFRLSSEDLKAIRKDNKSSNMGNGNYTNYNSQSFKYNPQKKIFIYTSPLIRGKSYTAKSPDENKLGCNNISNNKCGGND